MSQSLTNDLVILSSFAKTIFSSNLMPFPITDQVQV